MRSLPVVLLALLVPFHLAGQSRAELVDEARQEFEADRAFELLAKAANPDGGSLDSLWAVSVHEIAQTLMSDGDDALAQTWLRWASWLRPDVGIDSVLYLPEVVDAYGRARRSTTLRDSPADSAARTSWEWPATVARTQSGHFRFEASRETSMRIAVSGETLEAGASVALPPGTYAVVASAEGYDDVRVDREVLPGVTTVVYLAPAPQLAAETRTRARGRPTAGCPTPERRC